jgi:hypothetical protein
MYVPTGFLIVSVLVNRHHFVCFSVDLSSGANRLKEYCFHGKKPGPIIDSCVVLKYCWKNSDLELRLVEYVPEYANGECSRKNMVFTYRFIQDPELDQIFNFKFDDECFILWDQRAAEKIDIYQSGLHFECPGCWQQCVHIIKRGILLYN